MRRRRGAGREREHVEGALVIVASEQPVLCFCVVLFFYFFPIFYFAALIYLHLGLLCS